MPRAALLSIHARVAETPPDALGDPSLVQVWGPRFSAYVAAEQDRGVFTLGRQSDGAARAFGETLADRLEALLEGRRMSYADAGRALGLNPNALRYAAPTGRVLIDWDGARRPTIRMVPRPVIDPLEARRELARRHLHVFGPATPAAFSEWAGIKAPRARAIFESLGDELVPVSTPIGERWILAADEPSYRAAADQPAPARLLPSGDTWFLVWGVDRELLVADPARRNALWTPRAWPGAVLAGGEIAGTWRRGGSDVFIEPWWPLAAPARRAIELEAASLPLPGLTAPIRVRWAEP